MQVALAWLLPTRARHPAIPGTSSLHHLHENLAAAMLELPTDTVAVLNHIASNSGRVAGR